MATAIAVPQGIALVGPTGTSKTAVSLALASELDIEIVCGDSRQLYRGLEVATGKPTRDERAIVPHHLFDGLEVTETASAGRYARDATEKVSAILDRGRVPIVVGGSGFYLRALTSGLAAVPTIPEEVRQQVRQELTERGSGALHQELSVGDPTLAGRISSRDGQRVARGVEVLRATGRPLSEWQSDATGERPSRRWLFVGLTLDRKVLYPRLDQRTQGFFEGGLLREALGFLERGVSPEEPGLKGLGYTQAVRHLLGLLSYDEALQRAQRETRRYAKRQWTWWRTEGPRAGLSWIDVGEWQSPGNVARRVTELWRQRRALADGGPA